MRHGADTQGYIDELTQMADDNKIDITKVLAQSSLPTESAAPQSEAAPAPSDEPEFTVVEDDISAPETEADKDELFADLKDKFDVRKDS
jgi:hypothetical protein